MARGTPAKRSHAKTICNIDRICRRKMSVKESSYIKSLGATTGL